MNRLVAICAVAGVVVAICGTAQADPIEGQGVWLFDEGQGLTTADSSANGNNGTLVNGPTWTTDTPFAYAGNHALSFDGANDCVSVPDSASLDVTGAITVEAWMKPDTVGATADHNWRAVVYKERISGVGTGGYGLITNEFQTEVYFFTRGSGQAFAGYGLEDTLTPGTWNYVVGTLNATGYMTLYVNGSPIDEGQVGTTYLYATDKPLYIGGDPDNGVTAPWEFAGKIDEARILSRALSAEEVLHGYQHSMVPEPTTVMLLGTAALGLLCYAWRRRRS